MSNKENILNTIREHEPAAYNTAKSKYWLTRIFRELGLNTEWNLERCIEDALRFKMRKEWQQKSKGAYNAAQRNGWLDTCCAHMRGRKINPKGYWTLERCKEDALHWLTRNSWKKYSGAAYDAAKRNAWLNACTKHMGPRLDGH